MPRLGFGAYSSPPRLVHRFIPCRCVADRNVVSGLRFLQVQSCTDTRLSSEDCKDLESIPQSEFRQTCNKAMPPTYETEFKFKVPINNKWKAPEDILTRNGQELVNRPEFEFDFSLLYHLQYR